MFLGHLDHRGFVVQFHSLHFLRVFESKNLMSSFPFPCQERIAKWINKKGVESKRLDTLGILQQFDQFGCNPNRIAYVKIPITNMVQTLTLIPVSIKKNLPTPIITDRYCVRNSLANSIAVVHFHAPCRSPDAQVLPALMLNFDISCLSS